jgi:hypothetical protein
MRACAKFLTSAFSAALLASPVALQAKVTDEEINQAIKICSVGTKYDAKVEGGLNILKKRLLSGEGEVSYSEIPSVVGTDALSSDAAKIEVFDHIQKCVVGRVSGMEIEAPPRPGAKPGWAVKFRVAERADARRDFGIRQAFVETPAAIDIRGALPPDLTARNVFTDMAAETDHNVTQAGRWVYYLKVSAGASAYTQCGDLEFSSDGVPGDRVALPILTSAQPTFEHAFALSQDRGRRRIGIKLGCYYLARAFPVVDLQLKTPSEQWRRPQAAEFTVAPPFDPDRPPQP